MRVKEKKKRETH